MNDHILRSSSTGVSCLLYHRVLLDNVPVIGASLPKPRPKCKKSRHYSVSLLDNNRVSEDTDIYTKCLCPRTKVVSLRASAH